MNIRLSSLLGTALLTLCACTQQQSMPVVPTPPTAAVQGPFELLAALNLPDPWTFAGMYGALGFVTSVHTNDDPRNLNEGAFYVTALFTDGCTREKAAEQAYASSSNTKMKEVFVDETPAGFTWIGADGVGGDEPFRRFWCIRAPRGGMDILVTAYRKDLATLAFIERTFVPLWVREAR